MSAEQTLVGNVARIEGGATPNGTPYVRLRVAVDDYAVQKDGSRTKRETTYFQVEAWRGLAQRTTASIAVGAPVIVVGSWRADSYEVEGQKRTKQWLAARHIGPDLLWADVGGVRKVTRAAAASSEPRRPGPEEPPPDGDPWDEGA
jgi:single-stranded DNA-binding protein